MGTYVVGKRETSLFGNGACFGKGEDGEDLEVKQ
jgi:hypothetical protein